MIFDDRKTKEKMIRQLVIITFLAVTLVTGRPNVLDGHDHAHDNTPAASEVKVMEPKIMEPKVMEQKVMPNKVMEGKSVDSKPSDNKASSVNDGGRLLSLPEADACATSKLTQSSTFHLRIH